MRIAARPAFHYAASAIQTSKIYMEGEKISNAAARAYPNRAQGNYSQFARHRHYFHVTMRGRHRLFARLNALAYYLMIAASPVKAGDRPRGRG